MPLRKQNRQRHLKRSKETNQIRMTMNYTPDFITNLADNEIFVFGSNLHGIRSIH